MLKGGHGKGDAKEKEADDVHAKLRAGGRICDVAPTMLELLGIPKPRAMSGVSLFERLERQEPQPADTSGSAPHE